MEPDTDIYIWSDETHTNRQIHNRLSNLTVGQEFKHMPQKQPIRNKIRAVFCYV